MYKNSSLSVDLIFVFAVCKLGNGAVNGHGWHYVSGPEMSSQQLSLDISLDLEYNLLEWFYRVMFQDFKFA